MADIPINVPQSPASGGRDLEPGGSYHSLPPPASRPQVLEHAAIGNGRVLGLVSPTAAIEWLCLPRFDSPTVFARLLDRERGGAFRILANGVEVTGTLTYLPNTNVARTEFRHGDQQWEVLDFAPRIPQGLGVEVPIEIVRLVRPLGGHPLLSVDFAPRPDYGRGRGELVQTTAGLEVAGDGIPLHLYSNVPTPYLLARRPFVLEEPAYFVLRYGVREAPPTLAGVIRLLELTVAGWRAWSRTCALPGFADDMVLRSALCLKLHADHDTGAIIAAATTSIPEAMGTARTWDYRYCWLRDAAFTVEALRRLSHLTEGEQFIHYLRDISEAGPLQPVYRVDGGRELPESLLPHLAGYGGNGHVRIGNAASTQRQNDLMGEMMLALDTLLSDSRLVLESPEDYFPLITRIVEKAIAVAPEPDTGIWEYRTKLHHNTFSRAMCWVAPHRGARLARRFGDRPLAERWEGIARQEQAVVLQRGFNPSLGFFTQALDGQYPDAALLLLPTIGLLPATDPRFLSTLAGYEPRLVSHGLMQRYRHPDDYGETTSALTICSFWWAEGLALAGRLEEALTVFERVVRYANPVGLFSEDIDPRTGELLGNFPQAYTHVGLINAAMTIGRLLEARDSRVRAWS